MLSSCDEQLLVTQQVPQSCLTQGRKERGERLADILCPIRPVGRSVALRARLACCSRTNIRIAVGTAVTEDTSVTSVTRGRPLLALKLVKTSQC